MTSLIIFSGWHVASRTWRASIVSRETSANGPFSGVQFVDTILMCFKRSKYWPEDVKWRAIPEGMIRLFTVIGTILLVSLFCLDYFENTYVRMALPLMVREQYNIAIISFQLQIVDESSGSTAKYPTNTLMW